MHSQYDPKPLIYAKEQNVYGFTILYSEVSGRKHSWKTTPSSVKEEKSQSMQNHGTADNSDSLPAICSAN